MAKKAMKASPKKSMSGDNLRTTVSPGKGKGNYPVGKSKTFEASGYHSKPTGGAAAGKSGAMRKMVEGKKKKK